MLESLDSTISSVKELYKSNKKVILFLFVFVIFFIALYFVYVNYALPILFPKFKGNKEYNKDIKKYNQYDLILFYADWCPHCIKAKPEWQNLKKDYHVDESGHKKINGNSIYFREIDCTGKENEGIMDKYEIDSFPTVVLEKNNKLYYFDAKPTYDNLEDFLQNNL